MIRKAGHFAGKCTRDLNFTSNFRIKRKLFLDVHNETAFSVNVYARPSNIAFTNISNLFVPS